MKFYSFFFCLLISCLSGIAQAQSNASTTTSELVFKNPILVVGVAGKDGAIYRFTAVTTGIDALVKINSRSASCVSLTDVDVNSTGYDNAFQPRINYTGIVNPNCNGKFPVTDWYMEFEITFVQSGTFNSVGLSNINLSGLDIDGNSTLHKYVSFYHPDIYWLSDPTSLSVTNVMSASTLMGRRFDGGTTEHDGIDVTASDAMAFTKYNSTSSLVVRVGGKSTGPVLLNNDGLPYSLWFKTSSSNNIQGTLPLSLVSFTAQEKDKRVMLNWTTEMEVNTSHFVVQRSVDGATYNDAGIVFTEEGNKEVRKEYNFPDNLNSVSSSVVYYRLKIVDQDGKSTLSYVVAVRLIEDLTQTALSIFPNPAISEVRVTIPAKWQNQPVVYSVYNSNGNLVKQVSRSSAGQTETMFVADLPTGMYVMKTVSNNQSLTQGFIKRN